MIDPSVLPAAALAVLAGAAGILAGLAYFRAVRRSAEAVAGGGGAGRAIGLGLARIAAAALFFGGLALLGAVPLLAAFAGFLVARRIATGGEAR